MTMLQGGCLDISAQYFTDSTTGHTLRWLSVLIYRDSSKCPGWCIADIATHRLSRYIARFTRNTRQPFALLGS